MEQGRTPRAVIRDPARSYEPIDDTDLARLGRLAAAELDEFLITESALCSLEGPAPVRCPRSKRALASLHPPRAGIWDLDLMLFFAQHPDDEPRPYLRRSPRRTTIERPVETAPTIA